MTTWTLDHWQGPREMSSVGKCPRCSSAKTWRVGSALGGKDTTCAFHSCNSYFQRPIGEVTA